MNMEKSFLEKDDYAILAILQELYKQSDHALSYIELKKRTGIQRRVIMRLISELLKHDNEHFIYENKIIREVKPIHPTKILHYLMKNTVKYAIMDKVFKGNWTNSLDFCYEFGTSRNVFQKHVAELHQLMKKYDINFSFYYDECLKGEEHQIRYFYHTLFWGMDVSEIIHASTELEKVTDVFLTINPFLDYFTLSKLQLTSYILQSRTKNAKYLSNNETYIIQDHPIISFIDFQNQMIDTGLFANCPTKKLRERECRYLYLVFCFTIGFIHQEMSNSCYHDKNYKYITILTNAFIKTADSLLPFSLTPDEKNFLHINLYYSHAVSKIFKGPSAIWGMHDIGEYHKHTMPIEHKRLVSIIHIFYQANEEFRQFYERFPTLPYLYGLMLFRIFLQHKCPLKLLILIKASRLQLDIAIRQIKTLAIVPVEIFYSAQIDSELPDGIISDMAPPKKYEDIPFFNFSNLCKHLDFSGLESFLCHLSDDKFK